MGDSSLEVTFPAAARLTSSTGFIASPRGFVSKEAHALQFEFARSGTMPLRFEVAGVHVDVRELGAVGDATLEGNRLTYRGARGRAFWAVGADGLEEWLEDEAAGAGPVAEWEVAGVTLVQRGDAVALLDAQEREVMLITAPAAFTQDGTAGRAWLRASGQRLELFTALRGHVLVDPLWSVNASAFPNVRALPTVTVLASGKVLLAGGDAANVATSVCDLYDPSTGLWSPTGALQTARKGHTATLLQNGMVLVTGGINASGIVVATVELYDPSTGTWTQLPPAKNMSIARTNHTATLLASGKVLVVAGVDSGAAFTSAELFDPVTLTWATTGSLTGARARHRAVRLADGRVLVVGGASGAAYSVTTEIYNPAMGTFSTTGPIASGRDKFTLTVLRSGDVIMAGGYNSAGTAISNVDRYSIASGTWSAASPLSVTRAGHLTTLLPSGELLTAAGTTSPFAYVGGAERFSLAGAWSASGSMNYPRSFQSAALLPTGRVLVAAGVPMTVGTGDRVELFDPMGTGSFAAAPATTARRDGRAITLPTGKVLIIGGANAAGTALATAELFDPVAGTSSSTGSMSTARTQFSALLLTSGKVLVAGGKSTAGVALASSELYDPTAGTWSTVGSLHFARFQATLTALDSGQVLIAGGNSGAAALASAEVFDQPLAAWGNTGALTTPRYNHAAVLLNDGSVLVFGGTGSSAAMNSVEAYSTTTGNWSARAAFTTARTRHSATLLPSGKVVVAGGLDAVGTVLSSAELFDPAQNLWASAGALTVASADHAATLLLNGKVLVAGGAMTTTAPSTSPQLYDPLVAGALAWTAVPAMSTPRIAPAVAMLPSGKVLLASGTMDGTTPSTAAELYDEGRNVQAGWAPTLTTLSSPVAPGAAISATGTLFTGLSEGGSGGSDIAPADNPLVLLRAADSGRQLWLPASSWTATTLGVPSGATVVPTGQYWLRLVTGGVPSTARLLEVFNPLTATPATVTLAPKATQFFSGSGGAVGFYGYDLATNASGGSVQINGQYTAGAIGSVTDVVRVIDQKGRTATATVTVSAGVTASPATVSLAPRASQTFIASGGSNMGFGWALAPNNSGGSIDAGVYFAGATGGVSDTVRVSDSLGNIGTATVTITAGVTLAPSSASLAPKAMRTFVASGGSNSGFMWSLAPNNSGGSIAAGAYTAGATGSVTDTVRVVDSLGNVATANVAVGAAVSIMPANPATPPSGTINFTASGGSNSGFTWALQANGSGGSINAAGAYTAGPTQALDIVRVTDSLGNVATVDVVVTTSLSITPAAVILPPRETQIFNVTGGSGMGFTWSLMTNLSGATFNPTTHTYVAGTVGNVADVVKVTDSLGNSATATITVGAVVSVSPATTSVAPLEARTFLATGGRGNPFTWAFVTNASGGTLDAVTGQYRAGSVGGVTDVVRASDSLGNFATATITVTAGLSVTPSMPTVSPRAVVAFTAMGGNGTFTWSMMSRPSGGTIDSLGSYTAGTTTEVTDVVKVVDGLGNVATVNVFVSGALALTPQNPSVAPLGSLTFMAGGGSGAGFVFSFVTNASGGSINPTTGVYLAGRTPNVVDVVKVKDSLMNETSTNVNVTAGLVLTPESANVPPRGGLSFSAMGGSAPYGWTLVTNGSGGSVDGGAYTAGTTSGVTDTLEVRDAFGATARATISVTAGVSVSPPSASLAPGAAQTFTATGGSNTGFTWTLATNGSGASLDAASGEYVAGAQAGTDTVTVTDSLGNTASATVSVVVGGSMGTTVPFSQRPPVSGWSCGCQSGPEGSGSGALGVLVLGAWALARRRRAPLAALLGVALLVAVPANAAPKKKAPTKPVTPAPPPVEPTPAPTPAPEPVVDTTPKVPEKLVILVLDAEVTVPGEKLDANAFTEMVVSSVSGSGQFRVIGGQEIRTMIGVERQKQLMGCSEDSTCMSEIGNAMGSNLVLNANVGRVGDTYLVTLKLVDGAKARVVARSALQTRDANALLGVMWHGTQEVLNAYGAALPKAEAERWAQRPKQEPPAAITAQASTPSFFGATVLAVGGLQVLSEPGKRGSIGAEVDLTFRHAQLDVAAGVIIGPNIGARIAASWAVYDSRLRLAVGLRGAAYPGLGLYGGGPSFGAEFALTKNFGLTAIGAGEIYPAPGLPVVALLGSLGATARF